MLQSATAMLIEGLNMKCKLKEHLRLQVRSMRQGFSEVLRDEADMPLRLDRRDEGEKAYQVSEITRMTFIRHGV